MFKIKLNLSDKENTLAMLSKYCWLVRANSNTLCCSHVYPTDFLALNESGWNSAYSKTPSSM